jgi:hypothetical protein
MSAQAFVAAMPSMFSAAAMGVGAALVLWGVVRLLRALKS